MKPKSKILIIAGSDSSGGAGIQADIKTVTALGAYAMTSITAVTAQNTTGVYSVYSMKMAQTCAPNEATLCEGIFPQFFSSVFQGISSFR